jgi:hypothetical protein
MTLLKSQKEINYLVIELLKRTDQNPGVLRDSIAKAAFVFLAARDDLPPEELIELSNNFEVIYIFFNDLDKITK